MTLFQKFSNNMDALDTSFGVCPKIAVAVSGGADSLSCVLLMHEWVRARGGEIIALTVDHGLRDGSRIEAEDVARILTSQNIPHHILTWGGAKPTSHIQEYARDARYDLLFKYCVDNGYTHLAMGHQREDQVETFWMRLSHGSGLDGLSAMSPVRHDASGVDIIRPLLNISRHDLQEYCKEKGVQWINDPSNQNDRFLRVKLRGFEQLLAEEGFTTDRLTQTIQKLSDARDALQYVVDEKKQTCVQIFDTGHAILKTAVWKKYPLYIRRGILSNVMQIIAPQKYASGFSALDRLMADIVTDDFTGATLGHCDFSNVDHGDMLICKEARAVDTPRIITGSQMWDGRFQVMMDGESQIMVGALGQDRFYELRKSMAGKLPKDHVFFTLNPKVCYTLPAILKGENILAVPHLSYVDVSVKEAFKPVNFDFHYKAEKIV